MQYTQRCGNKRVWTRDYVRFKLSCLFPSCSRNLFEALVLVPCHCLLSLACSLLLELSLPLSSLSHSSPRHASCSLFSQALLPHAYHSSGVMLSMCNKLNHVFLSLRMPIMFHPDKQTHGPMVRRTSAERSNVGLAHARPQSNFFTLCL